MMDLIFSAIIAAISKLGEYRYKRWLRGAEGINKAQIWPQPRPDRRSTEG